MVFVIKYNGMNKERALFVKSFIKKLHRDRIYNYAASSAFFIILSIFPFLILLITLVQYTPITEEFLLGILEDFVQDPMYTILAQILEEIYSTTAGAGVVLISALGALWSSSKGIMSMVRGLNSCFNIEDKRNYFHLRFLSCIYTIIMIIVMLFALVVLLFGSTLYGLVRQYSTPVYTILRFILKNSTVISIVILTLLFTVMFCLLPAKKNNFFYMIPGAFIAAIAWIILSGILGIYAKYSPSFSYTYGSLTSIILLMLYLYFGMYILFIAAEINQFFRLWLMQLGRKRRRKKALKYDKKMEAKKAKSGTRMLKRTDSEKAIAKEEKKKGKNSY